MKGVRRDSKIHRRERRQGEVATRSAAIRMHCLSCCCWQGGEVLRCHIVECWLWPFRMGGGLSPEAVMDGRLGGAAQPEAELWKDEGSGEGQGDSAPVDGAGAAGQPNQEGPGHEGGELV